MSLTHLLSSVTDRLRAAGCVFAEDEARLLIHAADTPEGLESLVAQRVAGRPLEPLLGWAEFSGLRVQVSPGVFVPRRRTEFLVRQAAALASPGAVVVDLCCGSGAVGLALLATTAAADLHAVDIEASAVACARRNLAERGQVHQGDLYHALPVTLQGRVDLLVVNAPYVPTEAIALMPPEARLYEPRVALDGGTDGLDVQRRVAAGAPQWLAPGGCLLVETGRAQAAGTVMLVVRAGMTADVTGSDEFDATVVIGRLNR